MATIVILEHLMQRSLGMPYMMYAFAELWMTASVKTCRAAATASPWEPEPPPALIPIPSPALREKGTVSTPLHNVERSRGDEDREGDKRFRFKLLAIKGIVICSCGRADSLALQEAGWENPDRIKNINSRHLV